MSDLIRDYEGQLWTQSIDWPENKAEAWGITKLKGNTAGKSLSTDPAVLHTGQNSGFAAVNLAFNNLGAKRIILLGFDMMMEGNNRHWFGKHPGTLEVNSCYSDFIKNFQWIDTKALGIEIWNCTRRTALTCFPCYDLDDL
jgi:hypothetical protein